MAIGLSFFSTIGLSDQGLNLSDYRISDSEKTSGCPPLQIIRPQESLCRSRAALLGFLEAIAPPPPFPSSRSLWLGVITMRFFSGMDDSGFSFSKLS